MTVWNKQILVFVFNRGGLVMELANPLLESFMESPKACVTNSNQYSKEKETQICHRFVQSIGLLTWQTNPFITVNIFSGSYGGYGRRQTSSSLPRFPAGIATRYA